VIDSTHHPRLLNRRDAAKYCGMSVNHFLKHIGEKIPPYKFGRRKLWDVRRLDSFLDGLDINEKMCDNEWDVDLEP